MQKAGSPRRIRDDDDDDNNNKIKTVAKIGEELRQPNEKSDAKQEGIQHTKAKLREVL